MGCFRVGLLKGGTMPVSVVDQVFDHIAFDASVAPTGMMQGAIQKPRAGGGGGGGVGRFSDLVREQLQSPAKAAEQRKTDRAVLALSTIVVCDLRLREASSQYYGPSPTEEQLKNALYKETNPDAHNVYNAEVERINDIRNKAVVQVKELFDFVCGPPFDLLAAAAVRRAALEQEMLEERMTNMSTPSMGNL